MTNYAPCLVLVLSGECEHDLNIPVIKFRYPDPLELFKDFQQKGRKERDQKFLVRNHNFLIFVGPI